MARSVSKKTTSPVSLDTSVAGNVTLDGMTPIEAGFETSSAKVSGLMKGALMWYRLLLTDVGSNPLNKYEGTKFNEVFQSNINDREVLLAFVKKEVDAATEQLKKYQSDSFAPADEQVASVSIVSFELDAETSALNFSVNFVSVLGEQAAIAMPSIAL